MTRFPPSDLKRGDVILWSRPLQAAAWIRHLDGGRFDAAGICLEDGGTAIAGVDGGGVTVKTLEAWVAEATAVEARRFRVDDGRFLDDQQVAVKPVLDKIRHYVERGAHYAQDDVLQVALLAVLRRPPVTGWVPGMAGVLRGVLEPATHFLQGLGVRSRVPLTPAPFVFRCYVETGLKYRIRLPRARSAAAGSVAQLAAATYRKAAAGGVIGDAERELADLHTDLQAFLGAYYGMLGVDLQGVLTEDQDLALPDIVTPADLDASPSLVLLGRVA
jgi:hypothetical protein